MPQPHRPLALIILDGWGYREEPDANAIAAAKKPYWDYLWQHYPHTLIAGCGRSVGLPEGQMGNSEVGHLNMGAGRIVHQDLTRIALALENGEFNANPVLINTIDHVVQSHKALHIIGLLSAGGVHSHEDHIHAVLKLAITRGAKKVYIHAFLDGRDTPPQSALPSLEALQALCDSLGYGKIASIIGRFYAMDRDQRWDRIQKAYELLTEGKATFKASSASAGLKLAYERGESDEFVEATQINPVTLQDDDAVIFMNFRADRARELTQAFINPNFDKFKRHHRPSLSAFVTLTEYDHTFQIPTVFSPARMTNILSEYLSALGLAQLRIAETEKYAHVTFFFNGGIEQAFPGEERVLIPSPRVRTYDLQPEMSAPLVTDRLIQEIKTQKYDVIICNFANADMVGHTGNFTATVQAIETIDHCLSQIIPALLAAGGEALITADHGNAECMFDPHTHQPHTAHTLALVPLLYVGRPADIVKTQGILSDISPTLLHLMGLPQPPEMTGNTLINIKNS